MWNEFCYVDLGKNTFNLGNFEIGNWSLGIWSIMGNPIGIQNDSWFCEILDLTFAKTCVCKQMWDWRSWELRIQMFSLVLLNLCFWYFHLGICVWCVSNPRSVGIGSSMDKDRLLWLATIWPVGSKKEKLERFDSQWTNWAIWRCNH